MHKTGGFLHIQRILKRDTKRARRDKECAPQQQFFQVKDRKGNYRDVPGNWNQYAGYFPLWRLSYSMIPYIRMKFEQNGLGLSVRSRWQTVSCGGENK